MTIYPEYGDPNFQSKIAQLLNFRMHEVPKRSTVKDEAEFNNITEQLCIFEKALYQHIFEQYISRTSIYNSVLIYHGLGVGKTCSAVTIAESLLSSHRKKDPPSIWVIASPALRDNFKKTIFQMTDDMVDISSVDQQCTKDLYIRLGMEFKDMGVAAKRIKNIISSRYMFYTYDGIKSFIEDNEGVEVSNKVIIIDEAHNLRYSENSQKRIGEMVLKMLRNGTNNKLVLMSATPMYNEPDEILWLMSLLLANDKRDGVLPPNTRLFNRKNQPNEKPFEILQQLAQEYISYIKGHNPFTFAARLNPTVNGYPLLSNSEEPKYTSKGVLIPPSVRNWLSYVSDGLLPTPLGAHQLQALNYENATEDDIRTGEELVDDIRAADVGVPDKNMILLQANNICFPYVGKTGKSYAYGKIGFEKIAQISTTGGFQLTKYNSDPIFYPNDELLGSVAAKLKRVIDIIKDAQGLVLIYSHYVWSGILPLAVALEHIGFSRYGQKNILSTEDFEVANKATAPSYGFSPSYAVICGEQSVMGTTTISELVDDINSKNKDGRRIKVVLMTKIASEGLSFKNVREIHIVDPWYHLNRLEQVIGRAIRTCSHTQLPIPNRNVTVYLHTTVNPLNKTLETEDLHAYRISSRKQNQTSYTEQIIRDFAFDCPIQRNVNYIPESVFLFKTNMVTGQGKVIDYTFGDSSDNKPKCKMPERIDESAWRKEVYVHIIPTMQQRLTKFLKVELSKNVLQHSLREITEHLAVHPDISKETVRSMINEKIEGRYIIKIHRDKIVLAEVPNAIMTKKIQIKAYTNENEKVKICDLDMILPSIFFIFKVDANCYEQLVKHIIVNQSALSQNLQNIANELYGYNLLYRAKDIVPPNKPSTSNNDFVGYLDIFNELGFKIVLWKSSNKEFKLASNTVTEDYHRNHKSAQPPSSSHYGIFAPYRHKNNLAQALTLQFKLMNPGKSRQSNKQGVGCTFEEIPLMKKLIKTLAVSFDAQQTTREYYCNFLQETYHNQNLLWVVSSLFDHTNPFQNAIPQFLLLKRT